MQTAQTYNSVNDIIGQARQGSVAAIIQVLNEHLVTSSIRTRAILADGVLELLCEAATPAQLEQTQVVNRVQTILEELSPKNIRKVNINSRIVREQQLLWYEEITRDPENQLLWSEMIKLKQPNPLWRFWQDLNRPKAPSVPSFPDRKRNQLIQKYFLRGLVGGASLCLLLLMLGWVLRHRLGIGQAASPTAPITPAPTSGVATTTSSPSQDVFAQAVRLAEQTAADGKVSTTAAEWLDLAARWQRASELMAQVSPEDDRYAIAQDRVEAYQQNRDRAIAEAEKLQNLDAEADSSEPQ
jgi:hypothetical protein